LMQELAVVAVAVAGGTVWVVDVRMRKMQELGFVSATDKLVITLVVDHRSPTRRSYMFTG